ncbi:transcriptional repressor [Candidatus Kaiserbacteria bacterium]|nr:transcriptional repressor [Candidatus Kaiserbacteria bacterium]
METSHTKEDAIVESLRGSGFRVTRGRVALLHLLKKARKPLSIQDIVRTSRGKTMDQATIYRTLSDLANAGIVHRMDLNTGTAHFEYTPDRPHHHHLVCTDCGVIEDIEDCAIEKLEKNVARNSKQFTNIYSHNLEFFGHCKKCPAA